MDAVYGVCEESIDTCAVNDGDFSYLWRCSSKKLDEEFLNQYSSKN